jgi:ABC-type branched-subunit amino acid transport system substrate-binding protein
MITGIEAVSRNSNKEEKVKKKLLLVPLALLLAISLVAIGCPGGPAAPAEILVGVPAPSTGMYAGFGQGGVFGMQAAVDDINAQGGVYVEEYDKKLPLKLVVVNTESDPIKAGTLAESLIVSDKVHFLAYGDEPPPMNATISNVADRYKVPYVCTTGPMEPWMAMRQEVEGNWEYTWATGLFALGAPPPEGDFRAGPGYTIGDTWQAMLDLYGGQTNKKAALFASDDPDGVGWYAAYPGILESLGYDVCGADKQLGLVPMETTDFSSIINEWKDYGCEILWGNAPAPFFGALWKQCSALGFEPKMISVGRAPLFYEDVTAWGGDLPLGIGCEVWWDPSFGDSPGIGGTTPQSLAQRWTDETGKPLNRNIGPGYSIIQVLIDAVERAGSLDGEKVNAALAETDLMTVRHRIKFEGDTHFSRGPLVYGQWQKTDQPWVWECPVVFSKHNFIVATADPLFPIPY